MEDGRTILESSTQRAMGAIDEITATDGFRRIDLTYVPKRLRAGFDLLVRGWIADDVRKSVASSVEATVDGAPVRVRYGFARNDVSVVTGYPAIERCGYRIVVETASLELGAHVLRIVANLGDGSRATLDPLAFEVVEAESLPDNTDGFDLTIDRFCGDNVPPSAKASIERGFTAVVRGSIRDRRNGDGPTTVEGVIDYFEGEPGQLGFTYETDAHGRHTGFLLCFPTTDLALGAHDLHILARSFGGHAQRFGPFPFSLTPVACDLGSPLPAENGAIAELLWVDATDPSLQARRRVTRAEVVHLRGWILNPNDLDAIGEAFVAFADGRQYALHARQYRPDVAAAHRSDRGTFCGIVGSITIASFEPGSHDGRLYARSKDDQSYFATDVIVRIEVEG